MNSHPFQDYSERIFTDFATFLSHMDQIHFPDSGSWHISFLCICVCVWVSFVGRCGHIFSASGHCSEIIIMMLIYIFFEPQGS